MSLRNSTEHYRSKSKSYMNSGKDETHTQKPLTPSEKQNRFGHTGPVWPKQVFI